MIMAIKPARVLPAAALMLVSVASWAQLPADQATVTTLDKPDAHRAYINDSGFVGAMNSRIRIIDGDQQKLLGTIPTGYLAPVTLSNDRQTVFTADTYFSRGIRGERTDLVTAWNSQTLEPRWEVEIPTKRANKMPNRYGIGVSDDDRFVYVYNFTPATSVTVVNTQSHEVANEIDTAGCFYNFPVGDRAFAAICGDGTLQRIALDDQGQEQDRFRESFFNPNETQMVARPVRNGDMYYFVSFDGVVHPIDVSGDQIQPGEPWALFDDQNNDLNWGVGGWDFMGISPKLNRFYVLVHPGHEDRNWQDPSDTVWVYDLDTKEKVNEIKLPSKVWSMQVTNDDQPLLVGAGFDGDVHVYDIDNNEMLGTLEDLINSPGVVISHGGS